MGRHFSITRDKYDPNLSRNSNRPGVTQSVTLGSLRLLLWGSIVGHECAQSQRWRLHRYLDCHPEVMFGHGGGSRATRSRRHTGARRLHSVAHPAGWWNLTLLAGVGYHLCTYGSSSVSIVRVHLGQSWCSIFPLGIGSCDSNAIPIRNKPSLSVLNFFGTFGKPAGWNLPPSFTRIRGCHPSRTMARNSAADNNVADTTLDFQKAESVETCTVGGGCK